MNIRTVRSEDRWKYLRENDSKYFNPDRNTTLRDYLEFLYPENQFVYNQILKKSEVMNRNPDAVFRRYRPDARCDELNLIVEFDGIQHYQSMITVLKDKDRDEWFRNIGYTVVRIPYWIQLSREVVETLFGIEVIDPVCELYYSFTDSRDWGLSICPGSMCELGRLRFIDEFRNFDEITRGRVLEDLAECCKVWESEISADVILPGYVRDKMISGA